MREWEYRVKKIVHDTTDFPAVDDIAACKRCNRKLVNAKWRTLGYGPTCLEIIRYERVMGEAGRSADVRRQRKTARGDYRRAERLQGSLNA